MVPLVRIFFKGVLIEFFLCGLGGVGTLKEISGFLFIPSPT